jgi:hypothetical protein
MIALSKSLLANIFLVAIIERIENERNASVTHRVPSDRC